ncbi:MAG: Small GTP-binding domain protein [Promethearchaeota archaeon]|nr:MAG: Small GTP-binding domain protein [Candidatus Lokiarchaeota archaeon]
MRPKTDYLFKVVIFGDGGVGKTTLVKRYLLGTFENTTMTIGADFFVKRVKVDEKNVTLQIWDFGGEEQFRFILPQYVSGSSGGIFMFDISRYMSLNNFDDWLEIFREEYSKKKKINQTLPIIMVGGKKDLAEKRSVEKQRAQEIVKSQNLLDYIECSSKTGENVDKIFEELSREMIQRIETFEIEKQARD